MFLWRSLGDVPGANEKLPASAAAWIFIMKIPRKFVLCVRNYKGIELWSYIFTTGYNPLLASPYFVFLIRISFF
jgi:hypothetical protein